MTRKYSFSDMALFDEFWFQEGAMNFFNTEIETGVLKGNFFITSERMELDYPKRYTIRVFNETARKVETVGFFQAFETLREAQQEVRRLQKLFCIICGNNHYPSLDEIETYPDNHADKIIVVCKENMGCNATIKRGEN